MTMDKSKWPVGPWTDEPDDEEWIDGPTGLACSFTRNSGGYLCGYVDLPGVTGPVGEFNWDLEVHGGVTYARRHGDGMRIGFDCTHAGDLAPGWRHSSGEYRDVDYVRGECAKMASQVRAIGDGIIDVKPQQLDPLKAIDDVFNMLGNMAGR